MTGQHIMIGFRHAFRCFLQYCYYPSRFRRNNPGIFAESSRLTGDEKISGISRRSDQTTCHRHIFVLVAHQKTSEQYFLRYNFSFDQRRTQGYFYFFLSHIQGRIGPDLLFAGLQLLWLIREAPSMEELPVGFRCIFFMTRV